MVEQLVRVETRLWNLLDQGLREHGRVSMAELVALRVLQRAPGRRVQDLAAEIDISPGGASKLVERLVAAGLVERTADAADRRAAVLHLTDDGYAAVRGAARLSESRLADRFSAELPELSSVLTELEERLREGARAS